MKQKTLFKVNKLDLLNFGDKIINNTGFVNILIKGNKQYNSFEKIFLRNILNCFGKQYRIVEYCDIPTELGFDYDIDLLIKTNLEWIVFETFNRDYCLNKNFEKPIIVTEKDIKEIGITLFENNGCIALEIFSNTKHIALSLIHGILKCFGNYKIMNVEEGDIKNGTIFVNTDLPIVVYGEPLGHITQQMIDDYKKIQKSLE